MKRITAILLLGLLMFNWFGYRLLVSYVEHQRSSSVEAQLDNDQYDESQLVSIKIGTSHLSYYSNTPSFERVDGQLEIGGVLYRYVKRRLCNDSLEFLCLPDIYSTHIQKAKNNFFKLTNDLQTPEQTKKSGNNGESKVFSVEPFAVNSPISHDSKSATVEGMNTCSFYFPTPFISLPKQPPRFSRS